MTPDDLKQKGFTQNADGSWSKRPRVAVPVRAVETDRPEQAEARPLDSGKAKRGRSKGSVALFRVRLVSYRRKMLDPDAVAFSCKPLTDQIAGAMGVDDADARVRWDYAQVETRGVEGVVVTIESLE